jgi:hypothetical protein
MKSSSTFSPYDIDIVTIQSCLLANGCNFDQGFPALMKRINKRLLDKDHQVYLLRETLTISKHTVSFPTHNSSVFSREVQ